MKSIVGYEFSGKLTPIQKDVRFDLPTIIRPMKTRLYLNFKVGDQIELNQGYTATCQKINKKGKALFLFDQVLPSDVKHDEINNYLIDTFANTDIFDPVMPWFAEFKDTVLRVPYAEEIFGNLDWVEPSGKKPWKLMNTAKNRIAVNLNGNARWYWLMNQYKDDPTCFAYAGNYGYAACSAASLSTGVRPVFKLKIN